MLTYIAVVCAAFAWGWIERGQLERYRADMVQHRARRRQVVTLRAATPSEQVRARWN